MAWRVLGIPDMRGIVRIVFGLSLGLCFVACGSGSNDDQKSDAGSGGHGGSNVCKPKTCQQLGKSCGKISDGCKGTLDCGSCAAPATCGGNGVANVCGCKPTTCEAAGKNCGTMPDGCGAVLSCGTCSASETCGAGGPNVCGTGSCTPTSCAAEQKTCGIISDNCSNTLDCGTCTAPDVCGGDGVANVCACKPTTCGAEGKNCGSIPDGCGATLDCGSCSGSETCGGSGTPNVCGAPSGTGGAGGSGGTSSGGTGGTSTGGTGGSGGSVCPSPCIIPPDRLTLWDPGVPGGVPNLTTSCATLQASTYGNGSQDATAGIQAAIDACPDGQVVNLSAGTFKINSDIIYVSKSIVLRGAGAQKTFLKRTNGAQDTVDNVGVAMPVVIIGKNRWTSQETATNLTADGTKGSYTINVASTSGMSPGMLLLVDELSGAGWRPDPQGHNRQVWASADWRTVWQRHNPTVDIIDDPFPDAAGWFSRQDRPTSEIHEIASISGNTVTFTTPLHIGYRTSLTAQASFLPDEVVTNAGIEGFSATGGDDGDIRFVNAKNSWAKGIEVATWRGEGFALEYSFKVEVRDSYIHDAAFSSPGGGAYAISVQGGTSEALIENNIVLRANKVIVSRCSGAGSVVGYNYMDQGFIDYAPGWQEMGVGGSHMVGPHHMLFEGNLSFNGDNDHTHGSSVYHTYFRNHLTGFRTGFKTNTNQSIDDLNDVPGGNGPLRCAGASAFSYWMSFVGNVLGLPGKMNGWTYEKNDADNAIWAIGWENQGSYFDPDPNVAGNLQRDGNFDYLTNTVHWHGIGNAGSSPVTLPDSLYLKSKPAFFSAGSGYAWPWVDPTASPPTKTLPAKARFDAGTPFTQP